MIPFSGTFNMTAWLAPAAQRAVYFSPFVHAMELLRYGIFGSRINAKWDLSVPLEASLFLVLIGLALCRRVRRELVVE
jgi:capsular polysaccharide transport system permease protein